MTVPLRRPAQAKGALPPDLVEIEREKARFGPRRGEPAVTPVTVTLGEWIFRLSLDR